MSGLDRFVGVLSLFSEDADVWSVQEIAAALDMPASTVYRIVRDLVKASFLEPATTARYRLGSAFPTYDWLARRTDPVVKAAGSLLHEVVLQARVPCIVLLSRLCNDVIMCVAHEAAKDVDFRWSLFERGRPMPLTKGSSSKVVLAQLTALQRRKLMLKQDAKGRGAPDLDEKGDLYAQIRKQGYHITYGEIDPALVGLAAPICVAEMGVAASISVILPQKIMNEDLERRLVLLLVSSASLLTEQLRRTDEIQRQALAV